jgi:ABC-2 type transport system permease protein
MSSTVVERPQFVPVERRVTFGGLLRSEWIKFWSVRSVIVTMVVSFVAIVGIGVLTSLATRAGLSSAEGAEAMAAQGFDGFGASMTGAQMGTLIVAAIGVIVIAGEFSTGMIRTSFVTAPNRFGILAAKAVVLAVNVAVVTGIAVFAAFFLGQAVLETRDFGVSIGDDGVVAALFGNIAMLVGVALAGLGVGALLRNAAGGICTVIASIFVVPLLLMPIPDSWGGEEIQKFWFSNTAQNATLVNGSAGYLDAGPGLVAFAVWVVALLGFGALALKTRDV